MDHNKYLLFKEVGISWLRDQLSCFQQEIRPTYSRY